MPIGTNPPHVSPANSALITALSNSTYDVASGMFKTGGTLYYIALQVDANDIPEWFHASEADRTDPLWLNNPVFTFSLETYTVLADGTYDAQAKTWTYKGDTYSFRITQEGTKNIAVAFKP